MTILLIFSTILLKTITFLVICYLLAKTSMLERELEKLKEVVQNTIRGMKKANKNKASEPLTVIAKFQTYKFRRKICTHIIFYTNIFKNANKKLKKIKIFLSVIYRKECLKSFECDFLF